MVATCPHTGARAGLLETPHGTVETPTFMPVGTRGTVKGIQPADLRSVGSGILLANALHLHLRPGEETVRRLGGLHGLMGWDGPILTDSGGYQIFSLSHLSRVEEQGVHLRSFIDGAQVHLTPEGVIDIERALGADLVMAFDHCPLDPTDRACVVDATDRTHRWLQRCTDRWRGTEEQGNQALFGIIQGGIFEDLRQESAEQVSAQGTFGVAIGGLGLGEGREALLDTLAATTHRLPSDRPRYLMGMGSPRELVDSIATGVDMFDCVTPTRHGRNHQALTRDGSINLRNSRWTEDPDPIDPECDCPACARFSRGALRHLARSGEMLAGILLSLHNLRFLHRLMADVRKAILAGEDYRRL